MAEGKAFSLDMNSQRDLEESRVERKWYNKHGQQSGPDQERRRSRVRQREERARGGYMGDGRRR